VEQAFEPPDQLGLGDPQLRLVAPCRRTQREARQLVLQVGRQALGELAIEVSDAPTRNTTLLTLDTPVGEPAEPTRGRSGRVQKPGPENAGERTQVRRTQAERTQAERARSPTCTCTRVLHARRAARIGEVWPPRWRRAAGDRHHRHTRNMYGVLDFYKECRAPGMHPDMRPRRTWPPRAVGKRPVRRGRVDDTGGGRPTWRSSTTTDPCCPRTTRATATSEAVERGVPRGGTTTTPARLGAARASPPRRHRHRRAASVARAAGAASRATSKGKARAARLQDIFGRDNLSFELQEPRARGAARTNPQLIEIRRAGSTRRCSRPRQPLHPSAKTMSPTTRCSCVADQSSMTPQALPVDGEEHYLKSRRSAPALRALAGGVRQHAWNRGACQRRDRVGKPELPSFPLPEAFAPTPSTAPATLLGAERRYGVPVPADARLASTTARCHRRTWGSRRTSSSSGTSPPRHARRASPGWAPAGGSAARDCCVAYWPGHRGPRRSARPPVDRSSNPGRSRARHRHGLRLAHRGEMIRYAREVRLGPPRSSRSPRSRARRPCAMRHASSTTRTRPTASRGDAALIMGRRPVARASTRAGHDDGYKMAGSARDVRGRPGCRKVTTWPRASRASAPDGIHAAAVVITNQPSPSTSPSNASP